MFTRKNYEENKTKKIAGKKDAWKNKKKENSNSSKKKIKFGKKEKIENCTLKKGIESKKSNLIVFNEKNLTKNNY